uniref:Lipoxygenase domain-containing protein n=1 Tax=Neogobius melanostomus TaxID=47308 RepID=A0A8C6T4N3_9GOBI
IDADEVSDLPSEVQFSSTKNKDFKYRMCLLLLAVFLEYVKRHWKEDAFFGYQFLNGVNPMMIRRCDSLPENFPVTDDMVTLEGNGKVSDQMKNGNIFLCDYKSVDGVDTDKINNKVQYLAAPLVLFHKTPADELKPVAIQLKQIPAEDNPIFVSSDSEYDWLLAKIFVRSADFNEQQLNAHLLRTHLLAEVFTVALLRNLPKVHPLYKLLIPHTRFTLHINLLSRQTASAEGITKLMRRSHSAVTYESLCIKDNIKERGLESVPNFYYRDNGFKLWDIIEKFVKGVLTYYYKKDEEIKRDTELQEYIKSIFEHGFGSREETGIPQKFETVDELVKFVTFVIFTSSAQHAAVNNGLVWMPNTPTSLQKPPPTKKGTATEQTVLQTLPDRNTTHFAVSVEKLLNTQSPKFVSPFGALQFCAELDKLDKEIDDKNKKRKLPYMYLKPTLMENSVSI